MDIYNLLPSELQNKVKYYVLEHLTAKIIKEEIERLRCDEYYVFKDKDGKVFCRVDGRDFFCSEYFRRVKKRRSKIIQIIHPDGSIEDVDSESSDEEYFDEIFSKMFFVSSATSSDNEDI